MQLKSLIKILAVSAGLAVVPTLASAQAYPTKRHQDHRACAARRRDRH